MKKPTALVLGELLNTLLLRSGRGQAFLLSTLIQHDMGDPLSHKSRKTMKEGKREERNKTLYM